MTLEDPDDNAIQNQRERSRRCYLKNKAAILERSKKWKQENRVKVRAQVKKRREKNPDAARRSCQLWAKNNKDYNSYRSREYKYGHMTGFERAEEFRKRPDVHCEVCKSTDPGGRGFWHTDHCHKTNVVRGILCHGCNAGLGHAKDSPEILHALIAYLEKSRSAPSGTSAA